MHALQLSIVKIMNCPNAGYSTHHNPLERYTRTITVSTAYVIVSKEKSVPKLQLTELTINAHSTI